MSDTGLHPQFNLKLLVVGNSGVGKTCLLLRFSDDVFNTSHISTIGIDFKVKTIMINGKRVKLQVWDTAGQERFKHITKAYFRGAHGVLLVYDCTDYISFQNIKTWIRCVEDNSSKEVEMILVSNKIDLVNSRKVPSEEGQRLADEFNVDFYETSAKTDYNVKLIFTEIAKKIVLKLENETANNKNSTHKKKSSKVDLDENVNKKSKCCQII